MCQNSNLNRLINSNCKPAQECIKYSQDNFEYYQQRYSLTYFKNPFERQPQLIALENCHCETDKYLSVKMAELLVENVRIKQKFDRPKENIQFVFP